MRRKGYIVYATLKVDEVEQKVNFYRGSESMAAKLMKQLKADGYYDMRMVNTEKMAWCKHCQKQVEKKDEVHPVTKEAMEVCAICGREIEDEF